MSNPKSVLWPDLSRFGAALHVVDNPSVGAHFLKFSIVDRDVYARTCGLPAEWDLLQVMRDAGFAYAASETKSRAHMAVDQAERAGLGYAELDLLRQNEVRKLHFLSQTVAIKKEVLRQFIPNIVDADFVQLPVAQIKLRDHAYLTDAQFEALAAQQQRFAQGEPGVYYTRPADRDAMAEAGPNHTTLNELLDFRDYPPERILPRAAGQVLAAHYARFNVNPAIEQLMVGQCLTPSGYPLKAIRPAAVTACYASHEDAIAANGGSAEGIERLDAPYALPLAFEYPGRRLLVLRDARYIEVPNVLVLDQDAEIANSVERRWQFAQAATSLQEWYLNGQKRGLFEPSSWGDESIFAQVREHFHLGYETMAAVGDGSRARADGAVWGGSDAYALTGLRKANFDLIFADDYLRFLDDFTQRLSPAFRTKEAEQLAKAALDKGAASSKKRSPKTTVSPGPESGKREDAGVKIGGARKDYVRSALTSGEIAGLTTRELVDIVTKDNVWPPIDYRAMRDNGVPPAVAYVIREFRKNLPVDPSKAGFNHSRLALSRRTVDDISPETCKLFVDAVTLVRDAVMAARTVDDLVAGVYHIRNKADLRISVVQNGKNEYLGNYESSTDPFAIGAGWKFQSRFLPDVDVTDGVLSSFGVRRLLSIAKTKTAESWDWAIKEKDVTAEAGSSAEPEKAERPEPVVPHLAEIKRIGPDCRAGKDVDEDALMTQFSFRAVEYGTWLGNAERQQVLNHAYDAFMDLAQAIGLPPKAIGLGGELAIAFGSRGRGGKSAALAHYEPARNVINLTRLKGAGSLAHEWGHALDYWLAKHSGMSSVRPVSEMLDDVSYAPGSRLCSAFNQVIIAARTRDLTKDEVGHKLAGVRQKNVKPGTTLFDHAHSCLASWIRNLDWRLPSDQRGGVFHEFAVNALNACFTEDVLLDKYGVKRMSGVAQMAQTLIGTLTLQSGVDSVKGIDVGFPLRVESWYGTQVGNLTRALDGYVAGQHKGSSRFHDDATYYDGFRSKAYWSTRVEMFARAFESWVQDKIESDGMSVSQYLVYGKAESLTAEYSGYPRGEDRLRVAARFEEFFGACRPLLLDALGLDDRLAIARCFSGADMSP